VWASHEPSPCWQSPLPGDITPYTLCTIAIIRIVMRFMPVPSHATMWMPLAHAAAAGALVAIEDLLGWSGLQLAYGARAFLWGATGFYQAHSDMLRDPAHCVAVPYLAAASVIHCHCECPPLS